MKISRLVMLFILLATCAARADTVNSATSTTSTASSLQDKSLQSQSQQSAQQWGLSDTEWQKYQQLKQGKRGIQSPGLDPLTTLGVESDSVSERRRLAELWVKEEYQRTEKELAFQREVNAAWSRLYPNALSVNMGNASGLAHDTKGRMALFVRDNCERCDARLAAVLADNRPVDIYLVGSDGKDDTVRKWAVSHNIPVDRVRSRQITLNHDRGLWLTYGQGQMPVILQQGENGWQLAAF
ncbi:TIGR03759 family integrating conjugative element protein [Dickeya dianthicola]|uniref:TIGR03759 family integrating conjugative element protein n=1 Tax=Enterobacterales TaxID=91347 RepID=UPI000E647D5F|nr:MULTISPECIES: TIGR03759 family integrating conjugative element protein [Enterobacterales]AYA08457.1 TIGR03759 family integrating conjugative element protein [Rahnella aquatilis]MBU9839317.1 TIGR03759 family integrating conjugative element protein [Rahnella aceris]MCI4186785.1 TIGR03759 family integrating conjugative element protein [Dickeya dianthicola]QBJ09410.1 TIGR03759 family integrating conjugative element protein [Rahnella aquatilis]